MISQANGARLMAAKDAAVKWKASVAVHEYALKQKPNDRSLKINLRSALRMAEWAEREFELLVSKLTESE